MIGKLKDRLRIEVMRPTRNAMNDEVVVWDLFTETYGKVERLKGKEFMAARAAMSTTSVRIIIRDRPGLDTGMRIRHQMWIYAIDAITPSIVGEGYLDIMCEGPTGLT